MRTRSMFCGIDGTGPYANDGPDGYTEAFKSSFVNHFAHLGPHDTSYYLRGPGTLGSITYTLAVALYKEAKINFETNYNKGIYLKILISGYSRGGVAACAAARLLSEKNIPVHGLFLLDPVDRTETIGANDTIIPKNVSYIDRTQRDNSGGSRESFDTDCTKFWNGKNVPTTKFKTTHGGMGGCPWGDQSLASFYKNENSAFEKVVNAFDGWPDGYFYKRPPGGILDDTKTPLIYEGGVDGCTTLTVAEEKFGYLQAKLHYQKKLLEIWGKEACLKKLKVYSDAEARKQHQRGIVKDFRYKRLTGQRTMIFGNKL